ncbi:MAG: ABC transporter permease [Candidatus Saccharimonadales bacterium]
MQLLFLEHIYTAIHSLASTRLRTLLTTVGIAIGIASVTTILSLSGGVTSLIAGQVDDLDGNIAVVRPGTPNTDVAPLVNPTIQQTFTTSSLTEDDIASIRSTKGVKAVAPLMIVNGAIRSGSGSDTQTATGTILATTPELESIANLPIREGQFIDSVTNGDTAVIGSQLSVDLFGTDQSIGKTFVVRGQRFTVIGILKPLNQPVNYNSVDFDRTVIISLESGKALHQNVAQINQIDIQATTADILPQVLMTVHQKLLKNHQNEMDFSIMSGAEIAQPSSTFFEALTTVMAVIAAISLVVGGVGVMNIMLVGVAERTREIGLRKSVGASNSNIIWQFMIEAMIMSLLGGAIGYVAGYGLAFLVSTSLPFTPAFSWQILGIALALSAIVGCLFGLYPAVRAARKDPIESLRQYR